MDEHQINPGLSAEQLKQLTAELPRGVTYQKQNLDYLKTDYVHTRLNQIFGFDSWSTEITDISIEDDGETCICRATVRLDIWMGRRLVHRVDVGVCDNQARDKAKRLDTAHKGAVSDALKRCARTLGSQFAVMTDNPTRQHPAFWASDDRAREAVDARIDRERGGGGR